MDSTFLIEVMLLKKKVIKNQHNLNEGQLVFNLKTYNLFDLNFIYVQIKFNMIYNSYSI